MTTPPERILGRVMWFNSFRGFGFLRPLDADRTDTSRDCFVHYRETNLAAPDYLQAGDNVSYEVEFDAARRADRAVRVELVR